MSRATMPARAETDMLRWQVEQLEGINQSMYADGTALFDELMEAIQRNHDLSQHMIRQAERLEASKMELMAHAWREGRGAGWTECNAWHRTFEDPDATYSLTPNPYEETQEMPWHM